ncbi:hypothetical protein Hte_011099 [Hypoxylon texense]
MMVSLRAVLLALTLVVARAAANQVTAQQNLTTYVPDCAQNCLEQSLSGVCSGPDDAECLCDNIATIGPGSRSCVVGACSGNTTEQNAARSGYVKYCSDTGHPVEGGGQFGPGWSSGSGGWQTSTTTMGTSTTSPSTSTSTTAPSALATAASESEGGGGDDDGGSDLSKGAIAGIAVGGGIACILITGGLLFVAFRLGRRHYQRKHEGGGGGSSPQGPNPPSQGDEEEAVTDLPQKEDGARTPTRRATNAQLDGNPVSELHAGFVDSGLDPIKELPTHERPAELSADPISYDSPVLPQSTWR